MSAAVMTKTCPDAETLAAFSDGVLDEQSRLELIQHLADCGQCQHELIELDAVTQELGVERKVAAGAFGPRVAIPLAAAAIVVLLFGVPSIRERILGRSGMSALVEAAEGLPQRPTAGRLSTDFVHKRHSAPRGGPKDEAVVKLEVQAAAWEAVEKATNKPTPSNLHASGVGRIFLNERDAAVRDLERAVQANPHSPAILNDLAAAYIARGDYKLAHDAATKAWNLEQTPAAAWNIAVALDYAGNDAAAIAAWQRYLTIDPDSPWATEARQKLADLQYLRQP
jgi:hypothetical protein